MYHVSVQGVDERMINVDCYYYIILRHIVSDLFLAAAALSRCLRFLNQLPTWVGVSPVD